MNPTFRMFNYFPFMLLKILYKKAFVPLRINMTEVFIILKLDLSTSEFTQPFHMTMTKLKRQVYPTLANNICWTKNISLKQSSLHELTFSVN